MNHQIRCAALFVALIFISTSSLAERIVILGSGGGNGYEVEWPPQPSRALHLDKDLYQQLKELEELCQKIKADPDNFQNLVDLYVRDSHRFSKNVSNEKINKTIKENCKL